MTDIKVEGLKWTPWVGDKYNTVPTEHKLLIVGESHYHDGTEDSINKHERPNFTKEVVKDLAVDRNYYNTKMFHNLHLALCGHDEFKSDKFWELISFYNFIQRPMVTNKSRPNDEDHNMAWKVFFELVKIIKPTEVLFIGVAAASSLANFDPNIEILKEEAIGRTSPRMAKVKIPDSDQLMTIRFIQHTSQYFSHEKWHEYIMAKMSGFVKWITPQIS